MDNGVGGIVIKYKVAGSHVTERKEGKSWKPVRHKEEKREDRHEYFGTLLSPLFITWVCACSFLMGTQHS